MDPNGESSTPITREDVMNSINALNAELNRIKSENILKYLVVCEEVDNYISQLTEECIKKNTEKRNRERSQRAEEDKTSSELCESLGSMNLNAVGESRGNSVSETDNSCGKCITGSGTYDANYYVLEEDGNEENLPCE